MELKLTRVDGGFVAADEGGWLPGVYETEDAAKLAFTHGGYDLMFELGEAISHINGENRPIAISDVPTPPTQADTDQA